MDIADPWDFGEVYARLFDWTQAYRFDPEREEYWTHITTGTHVAQICLFLLVESRRIPGVLAQTSRSEEHTSELQSQSNLVCRLLLENKKLHTSPRRSCRRRCCSR